MSNSRWRVGVDVGGTFTDIAVLDQTSGSLQVLKVPSTPRDPSVGVMRGLEAAERTIEAFEISNIDEFLHGTTITTNALIERTFRPCALLVTEGLTGSVFVQDQLRMGSIYDHHAGHPDPLVAADQIYEVPERVAADGTVVQPINRERIVEIGREIEHSGIESVAVCLLFSFNNPTHEEIVRDTLESACPGLRVRLSSEVLPRIREWPRISTMLLGCSLESLLVDYVDALGRALVRRGVSQNRLFLMESNGGLMPFSAVIDSGRAVNTLLSGPAAGVQAAINIAGAVGKRHLVTMDVGGTSADIAFVQDGRALEVTEGELVGHQVYVPMLDLVTVGAGGGTLCRGSEHGRLLVGPQSAGADPGPACYAKGGDVATITDVNLVLGLLNPEYYLGGEMKLDAGAAKRATQQSLATPLKLDEAVAATAAVHLNEVHMADAIKVLAAQRGVDVSIATLVACGGAGPMHACGVADELGIRSVLVPPFPGGFSAVGLLSSDIVQDFVNSAITPLTGESEAVIEKEFSALEDRARTVLFGQGIDVAGLEMHREIDARYAGQGFELRLEVLDRGDVAPSLCDDFHAEHVKVYGHAAQEEPVEIVSYRIRAVVRMPKLEISGSSRMGGHKTTDADPETRRTFSKGEWIQVPAVNRGSLAPGVSQPGPLIVEQADTTTFVPSDWSLHEDEFDNLILTKEPIE